MGDTLTSLGMRLTRLSVAAAASRQIADDDRAARDDAIVEADDAGHTLHWIAAKTGMSTSQLQRILVTRAAARQR